MHVAGELTLDPRPSEPHHRRRLHRDHRGAEPFQDGELVDQVGLRRLVVHPTQRVTREPGQLVDQPVQPARPRVSRLLDLLDHPQRHDPNLRRCTDRIEHLSEPNNTSQQADNTAQRCTALTTVVAQVTCSAEPRRVASRAASSTSVRTTTHARARSSSRPAASTTA